MNRAYLVIYIFFLLLVSCHPETEYIGYYSNEFIEQNLEESICKPADFQKEEVYSAFDSISFFYSSSSTFLWHDKEQMNIDFGYLVAKINNESFILGKYTPTKIFNNSGSPVIEIYENDSIYNQIVGLNENVIEFPSTFYLNLKSEEGVIFPIDPTRFIEIDIENKTLKEFVFSFE